MAKMNMMPRIFAKTNKHGVPFFGVIFVSVFIFVFAALSDGSSEAISFLILVGSVFWMISYIFAHLDVLILRHRLPKAPRSFKVPCGPLFPCIGIAGTVYMILNISTDPYRAYDDLAGHRHHLPGAWYLFFLLDPHQDENASIQKRANSESHGHGKQHVLYDSQAKRLVEIETNGETNGDGVFWLF